MFINRAITLVKAAAVVFAAGPFLTATAAPPTGAPAQTEATTHLMYNTPLQYEYGKYPWHQSMELLWKTNWSPLSQIGVYPFDQFSNHSDFESIFKVMTVRYPNKSANDFDEDSWAQPFLGPGQVILKQAQELEAAGKTDLASNAYFRAATVFRIGYFPWYGPISKSRLKAKAWTLEKKAYEAGMRLGKYHFDSVDIPFPDAPEGSFSKSVPAYVTWPKKERSGKSKVVLMIAGLDHYRSGQYADVANLCEDGFTVVNVDMPGTGDAPITGKNPADDAKVWKAVMDWIESEAPKRNWDLANVHAWGTSTGSYYAVKISRSERKRLSTVVSQGTASHYAFKPDWLESSDRLGYPVALWSALAKAFGYLDKHEFAKQSDRYSLLKQGVLDAPSTPTLAVNGIDDTVFPIDDTILLASHGGGSALRIFPGQGHMGQPASGDFIDAHWKMLSGPPPS